MWISKLFHSQRHSIHRFYIMYLIEGDIFVCVFCFECLCVCVCVPDSVMQSSASVSWSFWNLGHFQRERSWSSFQWTPRHPDRHWSPTYPLRERETPEDKHRGRDTIKTTYQSDRGTFKGIDERIRKIKILKVIESDKKVTSVDTESKVCHEMMAYFCMRKNYS